MRKIFLVVLFFAVVVEVVIFLPKDLFVDAPGETVQAGIGEIEPVVKVGPETVDQTMRGVHLVEARDEQKEWELWADQALGMRDNKKWTLDVVKAHFFGETGLKFKVDGDFGEVESETKNLLVKGNVVIRSTNGYTFRTSKVQYLAASRELECPDEVRVQGPRDSEGNIMTFKGDKMIAHLVGSLIILEGNVAAKKRLREDRLAVIRSEKVELSSQIKRALFQGQVKIDVGGMHITGSEANFVYNSEKDFVKNVVVNGKVRVSDNNKWATSKNLKVNFDTDRYIFTGNPRVMQDNDVLVGEKIVFLEGGKRVEVQGARAKVDEQTMETLN